MKTKAPHLRCGAFCLRVPTTVVARNEVIVYSSYMRTSASRLGKLTDTKEDYIRAIYILSQSTDGTGVTTSPKNLSLVNQLFPKD